MNNVEEAHPIARVVKAFYKPESSCHDFEHLQRVAGLAKYIWRHEGGAEEIVILASYLHDLHRHFEAQGRSNASAEECDAIARNLMCMAGVVHPQIHAAVLEAIHYTEVYAFTITGRRSAPLECQIVRDADNLDALGAIGIARAFVYGTWINEPIWNPLEPSANIYQPGSKSASIIHHFYEKLLNLADDFDLETSKRLAQPRVALIEAFLTAFHREWRESIPG